MKRNGVDTGWSGRKGASELNNAERPARGAEQGIPGGDTASAKALRQEQ